jgi:hypothetical protein
MSGAVSRTDYFSYVPDSDGASHRAPIQDWNQGGLRIVLQHPNLRSLGVVAPSGRNETYFAKKHLLTHAGGKQTTVEDKARSLMDKRAAPDRWPKDLSGTQKNKSFNERVTYLQGKIAATSGTEQAQWQHRLALMSTEPKYGPQRTKASAFIVCDKIAPADLKTAFVDALRRGPPPEDVKRKAASTTAKDPIARLFLPADAILQMQVGGLPTPLGTSGETAFVDVAYGANTAGTVFAVIHWEACGKIVATAPESDKKLKLAEPV